MMAYTGRLRLEVEPQAYPSKKRSIFVTDSYFRTVWVSSS